MKKFVFMLALFACSIATAKEEKPTLNVYLYEQSEEETSSEVILMTEFQCTDPATQPFARALGVAEAFSQSTAAQGKELSLFLMESDQPAHLRDHISQHGNAIKLRFTLPESLAIESINTLLEAIQVMPAHVGSINRQIHEETKVELAEATRYFEKAEGRAISDELNEQLFELLPTDSLNAFMKANFSNAKSSLIIGYSANNSAIKALVQQQVEKLKEHWEIEVYDAPPAEDLFLTKSIEYAGDAIVVDGKIFMDPPGWWQQQANGTGVGYALLISGFLLALFTFGAGLILWIPAGFLIFHAYLGDPTVVERMRGEIFQVQEGFHYASAHQCVGVTLTPFERRELFVKEIYERYPVYVTKLTDFAAYYVLTCYDYNASEIRQFLYPFEIEQLKQFRSWYNQSVSSIDQEMKNLDSELNLLLLPYQIIRDADVERAHWIYNNSPVVIDHEAYLANYRAAKESINDQYFRDEISFQTKEGLLRALKDELDYNLAYIEPYLREAENALNRDLAVIQAQYAVCMIACKNAINYDTRMDSFKKGKWSVLAYYSDIASKYIMEEINPEDSNFIDFLDLRAQR